MGGKEGELVAGDGRWDDGLGVCFEGMAEDCFQITDAA
jgi:hypothetical protein